MTDIESTSSKLGLHLDEGALAECEEAARELQTAADAVQISTLEQDSFDSRQLESNYGALLRGYDTPRARDDGPLDGLHVVVKDNVAARGIAMTCGSEHFRYVPTFDATLIERLLDHGATLVGKANMDAFAFGPSGEFSGHEPVVNPLGGDRVPGGSSSGSGAAVAAGEVDAAIGTDTGGSIRIPAACCGVVGIKPSFGAVSRNGIIPFAPSLDTAGPIARNVSTARRVFDSIRGRDWKDATTVPANRIEEPDVSTLAIPSAFLEQCTDDVTGAIERLRAALSDEVSVTTVDLSLGSVEEAYLLIGATEFSWFVRQNGTVRGAGATYDTEWADALASFFEDGGLSDHVAKRVLPSAYLDEVRSGQPYVAARREATRFADDVATVLESVDALLVPTIRTVPPELGAVNATERLFDLLGNTAPFNLSGNPAVSVPIDSVDGLPVSVQTVAGTHEDDVAIAAAETVESVVNESPYLQPPSLE